ncbi:DnaJ domain-containing protein [Dichotomocladium elegans]|nr:DnaJ domain-containing protein [Dichotomocladium elegans]
MLSILLLLLAITAPTVRAWEKSDFEIFDLVDELETSEGKGTNFYNWLDIPPTATTAEIKRAYRKLSLKLHPDKNKEDPKAKEKFARLGKVSAILRDAGKRERYNFFYKNGVPRWRGTGYYYSRFRPGLGTVVVLLTVLSGMAQYLVAWVNYYQERRRIEGFVANARETLVQSVPKSQGAPTLGRSVIEVAGRAMRCEVKSDTYLIVYPEGDAEPIHLNTEWVVKPSLTQNMFLISWPWNFFKKLTGRSDTSKDASEDDSAQVDDGDSNEATTKKKKKKVNRADPIQVTGTKVGGRRRALRKQ